MTTTGINTQARVSVSSGNPTLILVGEDQQLTAQIEALVKDVAGNTVSGELYYVSRDIGIVEVSDSGLITAVSPGQVTVEVSTPAFGNTITGPSAFAQDGSPLNKVAALVNVTVEEGISIQPSFSFLLSEDSVTISPTGSASVTITQTVTEVGGIGAGPVTYSYYGNLAHVPSLNGTGAILNWADESFEPSIFFKFNNNVDGSTTSTFTVTAGMFGRTTAPGTYHGFISGSAEHYNPNPPAGSQLTSGGGGLVKLQPFTVVVS